jgi:hypothetical protein
VSVYGVVLDTKLNVDMTATVARRGEMRSAAAP